MAHRSKRAREPSGDRPRVLHYLQVIVYLLGFLLGLSLLVVGTIAVIAEIKGTWHWMIHLESTISYMAVVVSGLLVVIVPLFGVLLAGRWWVGR